MNDPTKYVEPESIKPADGNGLEEDGDEEGEAGRVVLQQVEDVEPALQGGLIGHAMHKSHILNDNSPESEP